MCFTFDQSSWYHHRRFGHQSQSNFYVDSVPILQRSYSKFESESRFRRIRLAQKMHNVRINHSFCSLCVCVCEVIKYVYCLHLASKPVVHHAHWIHSSLCQINANVLIFKSWNYKNCLTSFHRYLCVEIAVILNKFRENVYKNIKLQW